jgi:hypothetical protein
MDLSVSSLLSALCSPANKRSSSGVHVTPRPIGHQNGGAFDTPVGCKCHVFRPAGEALSGARLVCPMHGGAS